MPNNKGGLHMWLAHFGMLLESVQVSVKLSSKMGCNAYYASMRKKSPHEMKLSAQHLEWTLYAPKLISARISNPSESVWNFSSLRVSIAIQAYEVKAQNGTECQHPEWTSYAPRTCRHAFRIRSSQRETFLDMCRWHHEIHAYEIESQNETKSRHPECTS